MEKDGVNMFILDKPYVSKFLEDTIIKLGMPVLKNDAVEELGLSDNINLLDEKEFIDEIKKKGENLIYCNSENPINWITNNLSFTELPEKINVFKDKFKFRELIKNMYPDFYYKEVSFKDLKDIDLDEMKFPFVIKPSIGFFSMGVHKVNSVTEWEDVIVELEREIFNMKEKYPIEVIDTNKFIIEENIEGEEFAVDLYYDLEGRPIILNILKHLFSSGEDVKDRVYITSKEIMENYHRLFLNYLTKIGELIDLKGFPMHIEFRVDEVGNIVPIEVNPMRFAGWCTTDVAYYAYGINVYEYFLKQKEPDWQEVLRDKEEIYSIVIADVADDIDVNQIEEVYYDKFYSYFERPLDLRKIDYQKHGVFGFLFAKTSYNNYQELENILASDLKEYIRLKE